MRAYGPLLLTVLLLGDAGPVQSQGGKTSPPEFKTDQAGGRVFRVNAAGAVEWSVSLPGKLGGRKLPHLLGDEKRVYVRRADRLTALAAASGVALWHARGVNGRLVLSR